MTPWKVASLVAWGLCSLAGGLQLDGPVRTRRRNKPFPSRNASPAPKDRFEIIERLEPSSSSMFTFENREKIVVGGMGRGGQRQNTHKRGDDASVLARSRRRKRRLESKVKDAGKVPDLSRMLRDGLPYLTRTEATQMQLALAVSIYVHSKYRHEQHDDRVKAGVQICLQLGRLGMGTDALLAAILTGVLSPERSIPSESRSLGFGRAPVTLQDIREGFGHNVARLVAGVEHVTSVEETARNILAGGKGGLADHDQGGDLSLSLFAGAERRDRFCKCQGAEGGTENGVNLKCGTLRYASVHEQGEKLRNLIVSEAADWQVLTLWLAVHLQTLQHSLQSDLVESTRTKTSEQLARDALLVHGPLAHRLGVHQLRNELESAAFHRLFPARYQEVQRATQDRSSVYESVLDSVKGTLLNAFRSTPSFMSQLEGDVILQHRIKSPYSMWKKMEKKKVKMEGVHDAVAVRVVLGARRRPGESNESCTARSQDLCYQAMSVIQTRYPSVEHRLKDYIAKPKPNGYQSLHATQLVPDVTTSGPPVVIEFQVRSKEMHRRAEFGLAAHWSYKGGGMGDASLDWISDDSSDDTSAKSSKGLGKAVVPDSVTSGRELVDWLHQQLQARKVFVFGPDKRIWELDKSSATAADVLERSYMKSFYEGAAAPHGRRKGLDHRGSHRTSAWVNGEEVEPGYLLKNGDVFDVQGTSLPRRRRAKLAYS